MSRIVDTHHHLWDLDALYYPWLTDRLDPKPYGDYSAIRRNYLVEDYLVDIAGTGVTASVHLAAVCADHRAETAWVQDIADDRARSQGFPHAIVAGADLLSPTIDEDLDFHAAHRNVRGVRQILSGAVTAGHPDVVADPAWWSSIHLLARRGLSLDLQVYPTQLSRVAELARLHPSLTVVVDHCAMVDAARPELFALWREGVREIASLENVVMKISAFMIHDLAFTAASIAPVVHELLDLFGTRRVCFGSNYPVDSLACEYAELWHRYRSTLTALTEDERHAVLADNAMRIYRIEPEHTVPDGART